jgi:hypothetical protein
MTLDLSSPRAKLDRAYEHLRALDAETAAFYDGCLEGGHPYEIGAEFRADSSEYVFTIKVLREPPPLIGLLLGDFAHNLRAALDHLVCALAMDAGASCDTTQHPICSAERDYLKKAPNWLAGVRAEHRALIDGTQPYHAGASAEEHFLSIIQWLDNTDKHRALHPAFGFLSDPGEAHAAALRFRPNGDAGLIRSRAIANGRRITGDTDIVRLKLAPLGPNPHVDMQGDLAFEPAFGERWLKGTVLPQLASGVEDVIGLFG